MHLVVGIVAEGATDIVVIEEYLSAWLTKHDDSIVLEVRPVQPSIDATSGRFGDGGWTLVKAWCEDNPAALRTMELFSPLFEGERPLDFLIVQLDGDRVEDYTKFYPDITIEANPDASARGAIIEEVLGRWLWSSVPQRTADPNQSRHCLVATVRALETWLVAGLNPSVLEPEEIEDPELELMTIEPGLDTKLVGGVIKLKKHVQSWRDLARRTSRALPQIYVTCPHCGIFLAYVDALVERRQQQATSSRDNHDTD